MRAKSGDGLSYQRLAEAAGASKSTVQRWFTRRDHVPPWDTVRRLSRAIDDGASEVAVHQVWKVAWNAADAQLSVSRSNTARHASEEAPDRLGTPAHLPADIGEFIGREAELDQLRLLLAARRGRGAVPVAAITGMAGVGKTRLAVRVSHQLRDDYPDSQLYADLRGHADGVAPADAVSVLEMFLQLLGVPGSRIPRDIDARAALYRARLAGRRTLVLLDNAADEDQVRPLLPGHPDCAVVVTSRRPLSGLDGAEVVRLGVFTPADSLALMARLAGPDRVEAELAATREVTQVSGHLPLAVAIAARRLQSRPSWRVADLADRLRDEDDRLGQLRLRDREVRTVFATSYRCLPDDERAAFRRLTLLPGHDFTVEPVAALLGLPARRAEQLLESLLDEHLLVQHDAGRYRFHDLVRRFAHERLVAEDPPEVVTRLRVDVLTWHLHAVNLADHLLVPRRRHMLPDPAPHPTPGFTDYGGALRWCQAERANLVAAVDLATTHDLHALAWQLSASLFSFFHICVHTDDLLTTSLQGWAAARADGDRDGETWNLMNLGIAYARIRKPSEALDHLRAALAIARDIGDAHRVACALNNIGEVLRSTGRYREAIGHYREDLAMCRAAGDHQGVAISLDNTGKALLALGEAADALVHFSEALERSRFAEDHHTEAEVLTDLGDCYRSLGRPADASDAYTHALHIAHNRGDRLRMALSHDGLATLRHEEGDLPTAHHHWRQALDIFTAIGDPRADEIRGHLADVVADVVATVDPCSPGPNRG